MPCTDPHSQELFKKWLLSEQVVLIRSLGSHFLIITGLHTTRGIQGEGASQKKDMYDPLINCSFTGKWESGVSVYTLVSAHLLNMSPFWKSQVRPGRTLFHQQPLSSKHSLHLHLSDPKFCFWSIHIWEEKWAKTQPEGSSMLKEMQQTIKSGLHKDYIHRLCHEIRFLFSLVSV